MTTSSVTSASIKNISAKRLSDKQIVSLVVDNERPEFLSEIYSRYSAKVFGTCLTYVKDRNLAEDLCHDIFIRIFTKINSFSGKSSLSTWIFSITRNYCIDYLRKKRNNKISFMEDFIDKVDFESEFKFELKEEEEPKVTLDELEKVFPMVKEDEVAIIMMKYYDGMSICDIKDKLQISTSAAKMRVKRAKDKVRTLYLENFPKAS